MKAYVMALGSCQDATLDDLDKVIHEIICGLPTPLRFAPTSGQLALLVRNQAASRRWDAEQSTDNVKVLTLNPDRREGDPRITVSVIDDPEMSKEEAERRIKMLENLSAELATTWEM